MTRSWRAVNLLLMASNAIMFAVEGHAAAFTPLLLQDLGLSPSEVAVWTGLLYGIMMGVAFSLAPFWGVLAERFSRRWVLLRGFYLLAAAMAITAWASDVSHLVVGRILMGLCFGTGGIVLGIVSLVTPAPQLGRSIALVQTGMPIAASLGPPLGAQAIPAIGLRGLFLFDAVLMFLVGVAMMLLLPEPAERVTKGSVLGRTREIIGLVWSKEIIRWNFLSGLFVRGGQTVVEAYLPVRITQLAPDPATATAAIGWVLGSFGALTTAALWVAGRVVDRIEPTRVFWKMMLLGIVLTAGLVLVPDLWLLGLIAALRSIPVAFSNTLLHAHLARDLPRELRTAVFSLSPMPRNFGALLLPTAAASLAAVVPGAALAVGALGYLGASITGWRLDRVNRK